MSTEPQHLEVEQVARETTGALAVNTARSIQHGPAFALARMTDSEFTQLTAMAVKGRQRLQDVMRSMMQDGTHYGVIPGTGNKKNLLKPGGEVLRQMFHLVAEPVVNIIYGDGKSAPQVTCECRTLIHLDALDGPVVAVGVGACTSWERKYRYRRGERSCPECNAPTIRRSKFERAGDKGWYCHAAVGGCGVEFTSKDARITDQQVGEVENPDQMDLLNTIVKMAKKRADMDATITATASSDLLTQDMEDMPQGEPAAPQGNAAPATAPKPAAPASAPPARPAAASPPASAKPLDVARGKFYKLLGEYGHADKNMAWIKERVGSYLQRDVENVMKLTAEDWASASEGLTREFANTTQTGAL